MENQLLLQAENIKHQRQKKRRKRYQHHRLKPFYQELNRLDKEGYSHRDIARWLQVYRGVHVAHTTIGRTLKRWQDTEESPRNWRAIKD